MAHFQRPSDGDFGEYDADDKLAVGSLWRMSIPPLGTGAEVALWGGKGLAVRSNAEEIVKNQLPERSSGDLRVFRIMGLRPGATQIEFGTGAVREGRWQWDPGSPWPGSLQVQVTPAAKITGGGDVLLTLENPHMVLNAAGISYSYDMPPNTKVVSGGTSANQIISMVNAAGKLKHLVINCHGYIDYQGNRITASRIEIGRGFSDVGLFSQLKNLTGGIVWLAGCVIGNDNEGNIQRARNGNCYVVAPMTPMQLKPGLTTGNKLLPGKLDMFARFGPKVFSPTGALIGFQSFLKMGEQLGFGL